MIVVNRPEEMNLGFDAAFNSGDIQLILTLYESDAKLMPSSGKLAVGADEIRALYRDWFALKGVMHSETQYCIESDNIALLRTKWSLKGTDMDGHTVVICGDAIEVIRRQPDGSWRYIIDHSLGAD